MTIPKNSPQLQSHLKGTFSKTQRALPVRSLNIDSQSPHVTFEIVDIEFIERPHLFLILLKALRWDWLPLTLMPTLFISFDTWATQVNYTHMSLAVWSLICFHFSVGLLNDYSDYIFAPIEDLRINPTLERGWLSAVQIGRLALVFLVLGILMGLPVLFSHPLVLLPISLISIIGLVGYSLKGVGFKALGLGELVVYSCFGPLLVMGLAFATTGSFHFKHLCLGLFWGGVAATCLSFRQFENLMYDDKMGAKTLVRRLGFDRAKWLLCIQISMNFVLFFIIYLYFFPYMNFIWSCLFLLFTLSLSFYLVKIIVSTDSSLSSPTRQLRLVSVPMTLLYGLMVIISLLSTK